MIDLIHIEKIDVPLLYLEIVNYITNSKLIFYKGEYLIL